MPELNDDIIALVNASAAIAVFAATVVLAIYTRLLAKRTSEPFVVFYLKSSEGSAIAMNQTLINSGSGTAFDIRATMSPGIPSWDGTPKNAVDEHNVSLLPPGQSLQLAGTLGNHIHDAEFDVSVTWSSRPGGKRSAPLSYKINARDGFSGGSVTKGLHQIANSLEEIAKKGA